MSRLTMIKIIHIGVFILAFRMYGLHTMWIREKKINGMDWIILG